MCNAARSHNGAYASDPSADPAQRDAMNHGAAPDARHDDHVAVRPDVHRDDHVAGHPDAR